ncbi:MAG: sugar transferase [Acidobacteria bacterium]|nr:sugar transferase [Acidobacteriota bacterium]
MFSDRTEQFTRVLAIADVLLTTVALLLAFYAHAIVTGDFDDSLFAHVSLVPLLLMFLLYSLVYFGAYDTPRMASKFTYGWAVLRSVAASFLLLMTVLFLLKLQYVSRIVMVTFAVFDLVLLTGARLFGLAYFRRALRQGEKYLKVLVIGTGPRAMRLARTLRDNSEWGLDIVGYLDPDPPPADRTAGGVTILGTVDDISHVLKRHVVDEVIIAIPRAMIPNVDRIAQACEEEGVRLRMMADVFDVHVARMRLVELDDIPLLTMEPVVQDSAKLLVKRTMDVALTGIAMPFLLPLFVVVGVAIKLDSPGPVFFVQERVGLNKRRFPLLKFRTMVADAESRLSEIEHLNEAAGPIFKIQNDPRVTRVGRFLRRTSLDELPQLLNVLHGEMSLIGPRPMSIRDVDLFDQGVQRKRFSVRPGLACLREVSGRSRLTFAEWLALDLHYIENWSLALDLKIFLKLLPAVLKGSGAV